MRSGFVAGLVLVAGILAIGAAYVFAEQGAAGAGQPAINAPQTRPAAGGGKAALGEPAPGFSLKDHEGKTVSLSAFAGKIVVLEWVNPQCPYVQRHYKEKTMESLASKYRDQGVVWLAINTTSSAGAKANKEWVEKHNLTYPILDDSDGTVGRLYGAKTTPDMVVIDRSGKVVYKGAIDDDPRGEKERDNNYVDGVLAKLTAGQPVSLQETKPYGCSVKYSKK